jgi:hypothetical protein
MLRSTTTKTCQISGSEATLSLNLADLLQQNDIITFESGVNIKIGDRRPNPVNSCNSLPA